LIIKKIPLIVNSSIVNYQFNMKHLSEIVEAARARGRKRLAVAYGQDSHTIEAVYDAYKDGIVEATLFGDKEVIEKTCAELGIDASVFTVV